MCVTFGFLLGVAKQSTNRQNEGASLARSRWDRCVCHSYMRYSSISHTYLLRLLILTVFSRYCVLDTAGRSLKTPHTRTRRCKTQGWPSSQLIIKAQQHYHYCAPHHATQREPCSQETLQLCSVRSVARREWRKLLTLKRHPSDASQHFPTYVYVSTKLKHAEQG